MFELFELDASENELIVSGKYGLDQISYTIDFTRNIITFGNSEYGITLNDYYLTDLDYHLTPELFNTIFGLDFFINQNNLTMDLNTEQELPIVARILRDRKRKTINRNKQIEYYELKQRRAPKLIDGGFADYAVTSTLQSDVQTLSFNSGFGLHLLGGDVQGAVSGNFSANTSVFESNNVRWKTNIRDTPWISSIFLGQSVLDGVYSAPYTGVRISNDPIEPRSNFDEFEFTGSTFPLSEIELYLNNALIDYKLADELGNYRFLVPLGYGSSELDFKIYGPTGQLITRKTRLQVPFNFQPKGVLNYSLNAGVLQNPLIGSTTRNTAVQGTIAYGITKWLSAQAGVEYFTEQWGSGTPFYTGALSARIFKNYILNVEAVSDAYVRSNLNVVFPNSASINVDATEYFGSDNLFNSSETLRELQASIFYPLNILQLPLSLRISNSVRTRAGIYTNSQRIDLGSKIKKISLRFSYYDRLIDTFNPFQSANTGILSSSATYTIAKNPNVPAFLRGTYLRLQTKYIPSTKQLETADFIFSRTLFKKGKFQASIQRNFEQGFTAVRLNIGIAFNKVRSTSTVVMDRDSYTLTQNVRGSIGYDSNFNNVFLSNRNLVGRSGAAIQLFVDNDSNGSYSDGDELLTDAKLRIGRGGTQSFTKNGILYYTQMNSFYRYNMEVNIATVSNPMLVPAYDKFSIITDPNRFKKILIPFNTSGVMEGQALRKLKNDNTTGIGGLKVLLQELTTNETKELRTFSDGSFYEYPIAPGNYVVTVDPSQLNLLNARSEPEKIEFEVKVTPNGDFVEGLNFTLIPNKEAENNEVDSTRIRSIEAITEEVIASSEMLAYSNELSKQVNEALRLIIQAQNAFYLKDMNKAFRLVSESLEIFETAQGHALKGSFYYFEGNIEQAQRQWNNALRYNPDMYIPNMELLEQVIDIK